MILRDNYQKYGLTLFAYPTASFSIAASETMGLVGHMAGCLNVAHGILEIIQELWYL